jgi:hypothetical protein
MTNRYQLPDPLCKHKRKGIVKAGSPEGEYAATSVCGRTACIEDAIDWAHASTHQDAVYLPDSSPIAVLFPMGRTRDEA